MKTRINPVLLIWILALVAFALAKAHGATTWTNASQTVIVQGTNTSTNTVPKWVKRNTIGNSLITDDGATIGFNGGVHVGGTSTVSDNNLLVDGEIQTVGRVGIGVAPLGSGTSLTVSGVGNNYVSEANTGVKIYSPGDAQLRLGADPGSNIGFLQAGVEGTGAGLPLILQANNGNVGVGFIAPGARLSVDGGLNVGSTTDPGDNNALVQGRLGIGYDGFWGSHPFSIVYSGTYNNENLGSMYLFSAAGDTAMHIGTDAANDVGFISTLAQATSWTTRPLALQPNGGRVGIGTIAPTGLLHIGPGSATVPPLRLTNGPLVSSPLSGAVEMNSTNLYFTDTNGIRFKMLLNWTNYDDVSVGGLTVPGGASAPTLGDFAGGSTLQVYHFDAAQDDTVYFSCQLPHTYVQNADIYPHVHWCRTAAPSVAANTNVVWELNYSWSSINSPFAATAQLLLTNGVASADWTHQYSTWVAIAGGTNKVSSILVGRVRRLGSSSAADTYDQDVALLAIDLHVPVEYIVKDP